MKRKILRFLTTTTLVVVGCILIVLGLPRLITTAHASGRLYAAAEVPAQRVAIVFGAGLQRNGSPTAVLRDRIETAVKLYQTGKVEKLLMSGDNRFVDYNEPAAMQQYAIQLGVPAEDIVMDFAGRRTYDTCYRAREIFSVDEAILVTQRFHLPRALFTCSQMGIEAYGVPADKRQYLKRSYAYWNVRETAATTVAVWEVWISRPLPVLGQPEPIFTDVPPDGGSTSFQ